MQILIKWDSRILYLYILYLILCLYRDDVDRSAHDVAIAAPKYGHSKRDADLIFTPVYKIADPSDKDALQTGKLSRLLSY